LPNFLGCSRAVPLTRCCALIQFPESLLPNTHCIHHERKCIVGMNRRSETNGQIRLNPRNYFYYRGGDSNLNFLLLLGRCCHLLPPISRKSDLSIFKIPLKDYPTTTSTMSSTLLSPVASFPISLKSSSAFLLSHLSCYL
jgi:hypothetical protein